MWTWMNTVIASVPSTLENSDTEKIINHFQAVFVSILIWDIT